MSETTGKTAEKAEKVNVSALLISAVIEADLASVKKLVRSYGLSYCACASGGYVLLFVAIEMERIRIAKFLLHEGAKADCKTDNVTTPLHLAARQGFTGVVRLLLEKNVAVDARNNKNETPLHLAAKGGYSEVVEVLLSYNASVTAQTNEGATPLFLAAAARHETIFQMLLKHARVNLKDSAELKPALVSQVLLCSPSICEKMNKLVVCIVTQDDGQSKIVNEFVSHGFSVNFEFVNEPLLSAAVHKNYINLIDSSLKSEANHNIVEQYSQLLHTAVKIGRVEIAELFLKSGFNANTFDEDGKTSLCYSLKCEEDVKYVGIIRLLLAYGADITKAPDLLHEAVIKGLIEVCKVLIENGADVNKLDTYSRTPLFLAVSEERNSIAHEPKLEGSNQIDKTTRCKIIALLLNSGAKVNVTVDGYTALHHAVLSRRKQMVSTFLEFGVDVDLHAEDGCTPLFLAAQEGDVDIVKILCENDADVNAGRGEISPLCMAASKLKPKVVKKLLEFGANINFDIIKTVYENVDEDVDICTLDYDYCNTDTILYNHFFKSKIAGFPVKEQYEEDDLSVYDYLREELDQLKNIKLNSQLTLYDVLVNPKNPRYVNERLLIRELKSLNLDTVCDYKYLIRGKLCKSNFRLELLQSGQNWLDVLVKTCNKLSGKKYSVLPVEILEQIVSYLSNRELHSLIACGKALKHQLSQ